MDFRDSVRSLNVSILRRFGTNISRTREVTGLAAGFPLETATSSKAPCLTVLVVLGQMNSAGFVGCLEIVNHASFNTQYVVPVSITLMPGNRRLLLEVHPERQPGEDRQRSPSAGRPVPFRGEV